MGCVVVLRAPVLFFERKVGRIARPHRNLTTQPPPTPPLPTPRTTSSPSIQLEDISKMLPVVVILRLRPTPRHVSLPLRILTIYTTGRSLHLRLTLPCRASIILVTRGSFLSPSAPRIFSTFLSKHGWSHGHHKRYVKSSGRHRRQHLLKLQFQEGRGLLTRNGSRYVTRIVVHSRKFAPTFLLSENLEKTTIKPQHHHALTS